MHRNRREQILSVRRIPIKESGGSLENANVTSEAGTQFLNIPKEGQFLTKPGQGNVLNLGDGGLIKGEKSLSGGKEDRKNSNVKFGGPATSTPPAYRRSAETMKSDVVDGGEKKVKEDLRKRLMGIKI